MTRSEFKYSIAGQGVGSLDSPGIGSSSLQDKGKRELRILQVSTADILVDAEKSSWKLFKSYRERGLKSWLAVGRKYTDDPDVLAVPKGSLWARRWRGMKRTTGARSMWPITRGLGLLARLSELEHIVDGHLGIEDFHHPATWRLLELPPERPTLLHCHNLHGGFFDLRALPWLSRQVPLIFNPRDPWPLSGHCAYAVGCQRWKTGCGHCPDLGLYPPVGRDSTAFNWRRKRDIFARSRLYVSTPSQWLMDDVKKSMLRGAMYRIIPNAIDLTIYNPGDQSEARRSLDLPQGRQVVLMSPHHDFKDFATMKEACAMLAAANGDPHRFVCLGKIGASGERVGSGTMQYVGYERESARVAAYYQAADVYIHAARADNAPKMILEAMACGAAVVATATGGIPEQIEHGVTGLLVPHADPIAMAQAVDTLLQDADLRARLGREAARVAKARFNLDRQVGDFLSWYEEVIDDWTEWKKRPQPAA